MMPHLSNSLIGGDFKGMAGLSAFGRLYRISRLNSLTLRQAIDVMGIHKSVLSRFCSHATFRWPDAAAWDQIPNPTAKTAWPNAEDLLPYEVEQPLLMDEQIRGCPVCLRAGFHSLLHQVPWLDFCLWHHERLIDRCQCGKQLLYGSHRKEYHLLTCRCGHDYFDRLDALKSTIFWQENDVLQAICTYLEKVRYTRANHHLQSDGELSLDQAIAAAQGLVVPQNFLLSTQVKTEQAFEDDDKLREIILSLEACSFFSWPGRRRSLPILDTDTERLVAFATALDMHITQIRRRTRRSIYPFYSGYGRTCRSAPITKITNVDVELLSHRDFHVGTRLISRFVDEHTPKESGREFTRANVMEKAIAQCDPSVQLLAGTLSAVCAQALMEQWMLDAWRAYSDECEKYSCYGHPLILWPQGESSECQVIRVLTIPKFQDPQPDQIHKYLRPTVLQKRAQYSYYCWSA